MQSNRQFKLQGFIAFFAACAVGALAGTSSMVRTAAANETLDTPQAVSADQTNIPNEPAFDPGARNHHAPRSAQAGLDRTGRKQVGQASFYADRYAGKTMADGTPMQLYGNNAASLTLPLGTIATVTNLETGLSAVIKIQDRGPYVHGRIVDLSPCHRTENRYRSPPGTRKSRGDSSDLTGWREFRARSGFARSLSGAGT